MAAKLQIANADAAEEGESLYAMWLGPYGTTVYVWGRSFDDAFEEMVEWADDNAPGSLVDLTEADLKEAAEDAGVEWDPEWPDYDDPAFMRVVEDAETDLTTIGHTTLKHGQYIPSHEWGGDDVTGGEQFEEILRASRKEAWGHEFLKDDEVRWADPEGEGSGAYVVDSVNGDDLDLEPVGDGDRYVNVPAKEVRFSRG